MTRLPIVAALVAVASLSGAAQPLFRAGVEAVTLDVSVMRGRAPVAGLTAKDFELKDNGVVQELRTVAADDVPLDVTLAVDTSESMLGSKLGSLIKGGHDLISHLRKDDRIAVISFSHRAQRVMTMSGDFVAANDAIDGLSATGSTSLRDAIYLSMQTTPKVPSRPLVILFTDGTDTASWLPESSVFEAARRIPVVVHIVSFMPDQFLERVAETTAGRLWRATSEKDLQVLFTEALAEMRARYVLTYVPTGVATTGWHRLDVRLKGQRADVKTRPGYFVPGP
jgi:VWFA-related protein